MTNTALTYNNTHIEGLTRQAFDICEDNATALHRIPASDWFFDQIKQYYAPETLAAVTPKVIVL